MEGWTSSAPPTSVRVTWPNLTSTLGNLIERGFATHSLVYILEELLCGT